MAANARGGAAHTATRRRAYQDGALRLGWQCPPHGTARSGPSGSAALTATRRRAYRQHALTLPLDVERTGSTPSHCHSTSSVPRRYVQAQVAVSSTRNCTLRAEWQCRPHCHSIVNALLHALTLPLDVERTEDVALTSDDLAYAEAVVLPHVVPGHLRLVEEAPGAWSLSSRPARPPALPRRWYERDKHDKGLADQGPLGGHARRAEVGQPPGAAEAPLDCVPVVAGRQRLAGSMISSENVPLPRRRGLAGHRQARRGPFGPVSLQDRLARRDGPLRARGRERDPGRPRRPQGPEHDRKIDRFQGA